LRAGDSNSGLPRRKPKATRWPPGGEKPSSGFRAAANCNRHYFVDGHLEWRSLDRLADGSGEIVQKLGELLPQTQ